MANAELLLDRWDRTQQAASDARLADDAFRQWLMQTMPVELAAYGGSAAEDVYAHWYSIMCMIDLCGQHARFADALLLTRWVAEHYVPLGGHVAGRTVMGCSSACYLAAHQPELFASAVDLLHWLVAHARRHGQGFALATNHALMNLAAAHRATTADNHETHTRTAIGIYGEIVRSRHVADPPTLWPTVADALLERGLAALEMGDEAASAADFTRVIDWYAGIDGLAQHVSVARHAVDIMTSLQFPEPNLRVTAFAQRHKNRFMREMRRSFANGFVADARARHAVTVRALRRFACWGEPMVLLLRKFDLVESSRLTTDSRLVELHGDGSSDIITTHFPNADWKPLISRLRELTRLVHVVSTPSTALEADWHIEMLNSDMRLPLYLPSDGWLDSVRQLIGLAERIVVWAGAKTTGLLAELALLAELGRTADTVVLLETPTKGLGAITGKLPGAQLTADDPLLAGFPAVLQADALRDGPRVSRIIDRVLDQLDAVMRMAPVDRISRVRARIGPLDSTSGG